MNAPLWIGVYLLGVFLGSVIGAWAFADADEDCRAVLAACWPLLLGATCIALVLYVSLGATIACGMELGDWLSRATASEEGGRDG